ncbi:TIGR03086 family metal-binding protein [Angustibacter sp. Root456]|uniref:TIGR03086 family metal-binding protein n=1 Tax=Angustibacter sp. Root456 TaxID=1736539 RepID=UPI0006F7B068|nr:TIGR03086 family metal-binding protein [Angustibacter sp. Root456]KQX62868.1 hypothetical protein ASD06_12675 [Angustibacter sp. Root456]
MADDVALLESVLTKTEALISEVGPEQQLLRTPCPDLDVRHLVDHLVGWARECARRVTGQESSEDPNAYRSDDPAREFEQAAARLVSGLRETDQPAMPPGMLLMEFITHGWDLATATGEPVTYSDAEADTALATGRTMLRPDYRGDSFGPEVDPPDDATAVERLVAFLGRDPGWHATSD